MARWDTAASNGMSELKGATNASDGEMATLKSDIENYLVNNPATSSHQFQFAPLRHRNHFVTANYGGGWITNVSYGDR